MRGGATEVRVYNIKTQFGGSNIITHNLYGFHTIELAKTSSKNDSNLIQIKLTWDVFFQIEIEVLHLGNKRIESRTLLLF